MTTTDQTNAISDCKYEIQHYEDRQKREGLKPEIVRNLQFYRELLMELIEGKDEEGNEITNFREHLQNNLLYNG